MQEKVPGVAVGRRDSARGRSLTARPARYRISQHPRAGRYVGMNHPPSLNSQELNAFVKGTMRDPPDITPEQLHAHRYIIPSARRLYRVLFSHS